MAGGFPSGSEHVFFPQDASSNVLERNTIGQDRGFIFPSNCASSRSLKNDLYLVSHMDASSSHLPRGYPQFVTDGLYCVAGLLHSIKCIP